jgi:hypothetical protein
MFDVTIRQAYATLGLDASSTTPDQLRSRFRTLIRLNHPDGKPSQEQVRANETTCAIVEACGLLRARGFAGVTARNSRADAGGPDPFAWFDEMQREYVRSSLLYVVSPAFAVRFALGAWTMGWEIMWAGPRKVK